VDKNAGKTKHLLMKLLEGASFFFSIIIEHSTTHKLPSSLFVTTIPTTMGKTRIGVVLRESVGGAKSNNQSADLMALTDRYHVFVKKLHILIHSLQQHHAVMMQIDKTRTQVRRNNRVLTLQYSLRP
jgi:hypothetical protein